MMPSRIDNGTASSSVARGEVERCRQAVEHDREGRHPLPDRFAEVASHHAAEEAAELDQNRIVETEPLAHGLALLLGGLRPQHQAGRVADEVRHEEDDHDQTQQDEKGMNEPAQQVGADGRVLLTRGGAAALRGCQRVRLQGVPSLRSQGVKEDDEYRRAPPLSRSVTP